MVPVRGDKQGFPSDQCCWESDTNNPICSSKCHEQTEFNPNSVVFLSLCAILLFLLVFFTHFPDKKTLASKIYLKNNGIVT